MIRIKIKGEIKKFDKGMTVYDILDEFNPQYHQSVCGVMVDGELLEMDDVIIADCEPQLVTYVDLGMIEPSDINDAPSYEDLADYTLSEFKRFIQENEDEQLEPDIPEEDSDSFETMEEILTSIDDAPVTVPEVIDWLSGEPEQEAYVGSEESDEEDYSDDIESDSEFYSMRPALQEEVSPQMFLDALIKTSDKAPSPQKNQNVSKPEPFYVDNEEDAGSLDAVNAEETGIPSGAAVPQTAGSAVGRDDMQLHLGVPKISDLVEELLNDIEAKSESSSSSYDYTVDDDDMDAFLEAQILQEQSDAPESAVEDSYPEASDPDDEEAASVFAFAFQPSPASAVRNTNYGVDENSINDFVDYGRNKPITVSRHSSGQAEGNGGRRRKGGIPLFIKAAAFALVLLGAGWLIGRIAVQAVGSPRVVKRGDQTRTVSLSDSSDVSEDETSEEENFEFDENLLVPGKSNSLVELMQEQLCVLGYLDPDDADGSYNDATAKAINSFRKANKIKSKGNIDKTTFEKLFDETAVTTASTTESTTVTTTASTTVSTTTTTQKTTTTTVSTTKKTTSAVSSTTKKTTTSSTGKTTKSTAATTKTTTKKTTKKTTTKKTTESTSRSTTEGTSEGTTSSTTASTTENTTNSTTASKSTTESTKSTTASTTKETTKPTTSAPTTHNDSSEDEEIAVG